MKLLLWLLNHSQTLVESVAQDGDTFKEIGAAFKVIGDFKDAWSSAFRLRDSQFKVLEIATRLMTSKKRSAQRPFGFLCVGPDCYLLQGIKTRAELSIASFKMNIYSKSEVSSSLARSFHRFPFCLCFTGCRMG